MTMDTMLEYSLDHLLCYHGQDGIIDQVLTIYASEELKLRPAEVPGYLYRVATIDETFFNWPERERFLTWYYINCLVPLPYGIAFYAKADRAGASEDDLPF